MPLLGHAAMLLSFDVQPEAIAEHDDWHTHEHLPERLSIPGFLRGTRWTARRGQPRYFVMYEVADLRVLVAEPYLQRLNHPTAWTSKMMPHYRGMTRGLCNVVATFGHGLGTQALLVRFSLPAHAMALHAWLATDVLPALPARPGLGSVHLFEAAATPAMTNEQRIRGADAAYAHALLVTGYDGSALDALDAREIGAARLAARGAENVTVAHYSTDYTLTAQEMRG